MPKDKRDFFRVNHDVLFDFKTVDGYSAENQDASELIDDESSVDLLNELKKLDRDGIKTLQLISEKNRLLGDYLLTLSKKIDLIARHSLFAQSTSENKPTTRINLSEDGLAFMAERALYKDSFIAVRLVFLPSYSPVLSFAKVLRCEQKDSNYHVAAKFHRISEVDRQELSRQILKAQISARKKQTNTRKK